MYLYAPLLIRYFQIFIAPLQKVRFLRRFIFPRLLLWAQRHNARTFSLFFLLFLHSLIPPLSTRLSPSANRSFSYIFCSPRVICQSGNASRLLQIDLRETARDAFFSSLILLYFVFYFNKFRETLTLKRKKVKKKLTYTALLA